MEYYTAMKRNGSQLHRTPERTLGISVRDKKKLQENTTVFLSHKVLITTKLKTLYGKTTKRTREMITQHLEHWLSLRRPQRGGV